MSSDSVLSGAAKANRILNTRPYPNATDPFAVYLSQHFHRDADGQNRSEWEITSECNAQCCAENNACPQTIDVSTEACEDNYITAHSRRNAVVSADKLGGASSAIQLPFDVDR